MNSDSVRRWPSLLHKHWEWILAPKTITKLTLVSHKPRDAPFIKPSIRITAFTIITVWYYDLSFIDYAISHGASVSVLSLDFNLIVVMAKVNNSVESK